MLVIGKASEHGRASTDFGVDVMRALEVTFEGKRH